MPVVHLDTVEDMELTERLGVVRSLTRKVKVQFLPNEIPPADYTVLTYALSLCPAAYTTPSPIPVPGADALVLIERTPKVMNDPGWVEVTLKYEHILDGPNQVLVNPVSGIIYGKGKASVTQKPTNFYRPFGNLNLAKRLLAVAHTYPLDDSGAVGVPFYKGLPRTVVQAGEITIPFIEANFKIEGVITAVANPWNVAGEFIGAMNSNVWLEEPPFTWLCTEVSWDVLDPMTGLYHFGFEFQFNEDTWNPTVIFHDQRTGAPPATVVPATVPNSSDQNLYPGPPLQFFSPAYNYGDNTVVDGVPNPQNPSMLQPAGYWVVPALPRVDFNKLFGSYFEGFTPPGQF